MIIDFTSITKLFDHLRAKAVQPDKEFRKKAYALQPELVRNLCLNLNKTLQIAQDAEAQTLRQCEQNMDVLKFIKYQSEKEELLNCINRSIDQICTFESILAICQSIYNKGCMACQEQSTVLSLALIHKLGFSNAHLVQCIALSNADGAHQFVAYRRSGELQDVSSWGKKCIIFDSYNNYYSSIDTLPSGYGLHNLRKYKEHCDLTAHIQHDSLMGLQYFNKYQNNPEHLLHAMEKISKNVINNYYQDVIDTMINKFQLPEIHLLPSIAEKNLFSIQEPARISKNNQSEDLFVNRPTT